MSATARRLRDWAAVIDSEFSEGDEHPRRTRLSRRRKANYWFELQRRDP
jgi:hypothetical protein